MENRHSKGNMALLVLVDSRKQVEYSVVRRAIFPALDHFGMPYAVIDLAEDKIYKELLTSHAGIIIAQEGLAQVLSGESLGEILRAVRAGIGLVNFAGDIHKYPKEYQDIFGISALDKYHKAGSAITANNDHYLTATRKLGEQIEFRQEVEVADIVSSGAGVLLKDENHHSLVLTAEYGRGRAVQFAISPNIWLNEYLGHTFGLDDIFWKAMVWTAKKPFVMLAMPPFVTAVFDDCSGSYDSFGWIDIFNKYGYIPQAALFLDEVKEEDGKALKEKYEKGLAEFPCHGLTFKQHLYMGHESGKPIEFSPEWLKESFKRLDEKYERWGIKLARTLNPHFGEIGKNSVPFLKERGLNYALYAPLFGEAYYGVHKHWNPKPYGLFQSHLDYNPEYPDFYHVRPPYESWKGQEQIDENHFKLISANRHSSADFLYRPVGFGNSSGCKEPPKSRLSNAGMEQAIQAAVLQLRSGLDSMFFGMLHTHEQPLSELSPEDLERLLSSVDKETSKYNKIFKGFDYIAEYAENRAQSRINLCNYESSKKEIVCEVIGRSAIPLQLYVFQNRGEEAEYYFEDIPEFNKSTKIIFAGHIPTQRLYPSTCLPDIIQTPKAR